MSEIKRPRGKMEEYRDKTSQWRFRLKASNGKILFNCGEGFSSRTMMRKSKSRIISMIKEDRYATFVFEL